MSQQIKYALIFYEQAACKKDTKSEKGLLEFEGQ